MDTILDMTKVFLSSICFRLLPTDVEWENVFLLFMLGNFIGILVWKCDTGHLHNGFNLFMIKCNG